MPNIKATTIPRAGFLFVIQYPFCLYNYTVYVNRLYSIINKTTYKMQKWTLYNHKRYSQKATGKIKCPYCDGYYYKLASHTTQRHGVNAHALKIELNVPQSRGLLCETKRQHLRELAYKNNNKVIDTNLLQKGKATRMQKGNSQGRPKGKYSAIDTLFVTV